MKPIHVESFYHDGRGPELVKMHWGRRNVGLLAIDYFPPDVVHDDASICHVRFKGLQVCMTTPEEVVKALPMGLAAHRPAAMFNLGKDAWYNEFSPRHLSECSHFQLMFYDDLVDVICEDLYCAQGAFRQRAHP